MILLSWIWEEGFFFFFPGMVHVFHVSFELAVAFLFFNFSMVLHWHIQSHIISRPQCRWWKVFGLGINVSLSDFVQKLQIKIATVEKEALSPSPNT